MKKWSWVKMGIAAALFIIPVLSEGKENNVQKVLAPSGGLTEAQKLEKAEREKKAAAGLNQTEWAVEMIPVSGSREAKRPVKDTLFFEGGKVTSKRLVDSGYPGSNYTLTVEDDGAVVWETMQTKEGEGVAFWRGELRGEEMRGILSKHPVKGDPMDLSFSGKMMQNTPSAASAIPKATPDSAGKKTSTGAGSH